MRVLVVGGGIAGLATACGLIRGGHDVRVFERAPMLRTAGGAVTLWSNGLGILDAFGVDLEGVGQRIDVLEAWRDGGGQIWHIDVTRIATRLGNGSMTIPRRRLVERLAAAVPAGAVEYGREVTDVQADGTGVRVRCADGETVLGDVLVGADGHRSIVRRRFVDADEARLTGWATWQGLGAIDHELTRGHTGVNVIGAGGVCGLLPAGEGLLQWWFELRWSASASMPSSPVTMLRERFGGWRAPVPEILARVSEAELFPHMQHRVPRVWGVGRCTLVGDSAHVMPPALAQGANQSLEDAWVLSRALTDDATVVADLRRYVRVRRRKVALVSRLATFATVHQEGPLRRVGRLPSGLVTSAYAAGLRRTSTFLSP
jgi:FAD-dependent urate hydroxylase